MDDLASTYIAAASVAVGVSALAVAIYQAHVTRKHNRISSMPLPIAEVEWHEQNPRLRIYLTNKGLGPALLTAQVIALRDGQVQSFQCDRDKAALLASVNFLEARVTTASWLGRGSNLPDGRTVQDVLAPGDRPLLIDISCDLPAPEMFERLARLTFIVNLESVYGERYTEVVRLADHTPPIHHNFDWSVVKSPSPTTEAEP